MSGHIETEMTDCLEQMARLQAKMEHLQEEKNKQAAEEVAKQNTTEPNLRIMSEWLDKYGEILEEIERERIIEEQYDKYTTGRNAFNEEEKFIITEKYLDLCEKKKSNRNYYKREDSAGVSGHCYGNEFISRKDIINKAPKFIHTILNLPTYFMKQYIEATHNLFVIQQKKIDELEQKIETLAL